MSFNQEHFVGGFIHDSVTNSLQEPDSAIPVLEAGVIPLTTVALVTGTRPLFITSIVAIFNDIAVTDPMPALNTDLGWAVFSSSDGTATPTYASVVGFTAAADLPQILTDAAPTALLATANVPYPLFSWVGGAANTSIAAEPAVVNGRQAPIRIAADTLFQVRVGLYAAGVLTAVTGLDNLGILVYGFHV